MAAGSGVTLADRIAVLLLERGSLPACDIASELHKRKAVVIATLSHDGRFVRTGRTKATLWSVGVPSLSADEAAVRWDCDPAMATEFIFGSGGFVERGFVAHGNGRVIATERGLKIAALVEATRT